MELFVLVLVGVLPLSAQPPPPPAAASDNYAIWYDVLDGGGQFSSSALYQQVGSVEGFSGTEKDLNLVAECQTGWCAAVSTPPEVRPADVAHLQGQYLTIPIKLLFGNAVDPEAGDLELVAFQPVSFSGAQLVLTNQSILFTPAPGYEGNDQFSYIAQDINGATVTSWFLFRTVRSEAPQLSPIPDMQLFSAGRLKIQLVGIPGYSYQVQVSDNLTDWTTFQTVVADLLGRFQVDDSAVFAHPRRYYRALSP